MRLTITFPIRRSSFVATVLLFALVAGVFGQAGEFDLEQRRREHWAWQPLLQPALPSAVDHLWSQNPVDRFIHARLSAEGLTPAKPADRATLIRRLSFDLTGLPPSPQDVEAFLADNSHSAYERLVDRLLGSPQFGERWARHWLDLVRYAETLGHEFDYPIPNAWRYRDYVIRAFNNDAPYDQFLLEHVAGDLIGKPRFNAAGENESIVGTAFFWFGQQAHSPVDLRLNQAEVVENQIDVLTKTFMGMTVACARCHDHKFDAISTRDYYSLYGVITSSRYAQRSLRSPDEFAPASRKLAQTKEALRQQLALLWIRQLPAVARYFVAARNAILNDASNAGSAHLNPTATSSTNAPIAENSVEPERLTSWIRSLQELKSTKTDGNAAANTSATHMSLADFSSEDFSNWFVDGQAFGSAPMQPGDFIIGSATNPIANIATQAIAHSAHLSRRLQGALRSPTFTITNRYLHLHAAGIESRINVVIDNFVMVQDPIYGGLRRVLNNDRLHWITIDLGMWQGHRAYLEFSDIPTPDLAGGGKREGYSPNGYIAVSRVVASDNRPPPVSSGAPNAIAVSRMLFGDNSPASADGFEQLVRDSIQHWTASVEKPDANKLALLDWLVQNRHFVSPETSNPISTNAAIAELLAEYANIESNIPIPERTAAMADGSGLDEAVFVRGNPKTLGSTMPRRFLEAIAGPDAEPFCDGSGRLDLARWLVDARTPLVPRVMANRVWAHLFGRGIVATPDDFGVLGQRPTHPELLDWLACYFREEAKWSVKQLIRLLVTSNAYQMSSAPSDDRAEENDPENRLLHRMPIRRLESETIRDTILTVSGQLDPAMYGPSVPVHLTEFMDGRGRPGKSGPLDGNRRRSIYLEVRRNFLSPLMRAFDAPVPFTTVGHRQLSNVPAQSLILMNDPFVIEQAQHWAANLLNDDTSDETKKIRNLYLAAFSRPPNVDESHAALQFLERQRRDYSDGNISASAIPDRIWTDLCHVIINLKEFIFLP